MNFVKFNVYYDGLAFFHPLAPPPIVFTALHTIHAVNAYFKLKKDPANKWANPLRTRTFGMAACCAGCFFFFFLVSDCSLSPVIMRFKLFYHGNVVVDHEC